MRPLFKRRANLGTTNTLLRELTACKSVRDADAQYSFRNYTRMNLKTYSNLFAMIEPKISGSPRFRKPISCGRQICRYFTVLCNRYAM